MKKALLFFALVYIIAANSFGQISQGGKPFSFYEQNAVNLNPVVPTSTMPFVDVAALMEEDLVVDQIKDIPWRFGQNIDVILNRDNSGITEILPNGDKLWRLRIYSQGAQSINLTFDHYRLPPTAQLFVYNDYHSDLIGAFTEFNNQDDGVFATTLVRGDAVIVEYYEPANVAFAGELEINRVTHGYRGPYEYMKGLNTSGACQINVKCPTGVGWEDPNNSACMLVVGGSGFCSGAMVNNTANDGTPYILTANHCSTSNDFASWVFWFKWESATCTNPTSSPTYNSVSGSTLKARSAGSDFCLVQMNSTPPTSYNVYYAGWDHSGTPPTSGMSIHHPDGDITKISACGAMTLDSYNSATCWKTPWTGAACTEPGSSGSPIFDQNKRIVGQLYGGPSACGASQMWDYYGCFHTSWVGGGTSSTRLSNWLDPGSTGATTVNGMYNGSGSTVTANFSGTPLAIPVGGTVNFTDLSTGSPTSWSWSFTGGTPATSTTQNPTAIQYNTAGIYTVSLTATNSNGSDVETKLNYITVGDPPPVANFTANVTSIPVGGTVNFTDLSAGSPTSWSWTFSGGTPASATTQNPTGIQYNTAGVYAVSLTVTNVAGTDNETKTSYIYVGSSPGTATCDTVRLPLPGNMVMYSIRYTNGAYGYVSGNNGYSDKAKADFFMPASPYNKLVGVYFKFGKAKRIPSHVFSIPVKVWNNSGPGGAPGTVLRTDSIPFMQIYTDVNTNKYTFLEFATPMDMTGSFYLGVELPQVAGDTIVLLTNKNGQTSPGTAWEQWRDGNWYAYSDSLSWGYNLSHAIFPVLCKQDYSIEETTNDDISIYPNPTNQQFTIDFGSKMAGNADVKVFNSLGALVKEIAMDASPVSQIQIDMGEFQSGIYIVSISNGSQRFIRKLSLMK
jgi:PKD repeat protein